MSSIASDATSITVSAFGEEMELEKAIDKVYGELQNALNYCHSATRELSMEVEREGDFKEVMNHAFDIQNFIDEMTVLFKELKVVVKQVVGRPKTDDEKEWVKKRKEEIKRKKAQEKAMEKAEREKLKNDALNQGKALNEFMKQ